MVARTQIGGAMLAFALLAGCAADVGAQTDDLNCKFRHRVLEVNSFQAMPAPIQEYLRPKFNFDDPHTGGIAPRGGEWNATDVVMHDAPFRRFIRAGHSGETWFLWWERGGIAYWRELAVFTLNEGQLTLHAHTMLPAQNPCAATDALLDGGPSSGGEVPW